ncbi:toll-like receptor 13 [Hyperolius riggenbachi]|uniref:toll-like receptor 13 n=1 Tax=Hyperolius riggenbachi TaxID=752182 RepID=UPI0035A341DA
MMSPLFAWLVMVSFIQPGYNFVIRGCEVHNQQTPKILCYKRGLDQVPEHLPSGTILLDISFNRISIIKTLDLRNLTHLQELNVSDNHISIIESGSFQILTALKILNLNNNKLMTVHASMFEGLQNLTHLFLENNHIILVQPMVFSPLGNLRVIKLSSNPLQTLEFICSVSHLGNLEEIYIANISLKNFSSSEIQTISSSVRIVDISRNPLASISITTGVLQGLTFLNISFSGPSFKWEIRDPCFLKQLKKLHVENTSLSLSILSNIIRSLNCSLLEEVNLGHLNLTDSDHIIQEICLIHPQILTLLLQANKYTQFQMNTFQNCSNLKSLDISYNQFMHVTGSTFQHLASLEHLSLASNKLTALPTNFSQMDSLERMNLSANQLTEIYLNDTSSFPNLTELYLSENKISHFQSSSHLTWKLTYLDLGQNFLIDISESFGANLKNLMNLILRKNKLSSLTKNTFQNLTCLKILNLADNQIEYIEPEAFKGLQKLQALILGSNKLTSNIFQNNTFQGLESLIELQLFSNYMEYDSSEKLTVPPFYALKSLKLLTLNSQGHNGMRNLPINFFEGLVSLNKTLLGNLALSTIDNNIFTYIPQLKELDIGSNPIPVLDTNLLKPLCNLTELHLSRMTLQSLDFLIGLNLSKLVVLRAVGNQINIFNETQQKALPSLLFLDLRSNPLLCSCENIWFIDWVQRNPKTQVLHFYDYICAYPPSSKGQKLSNFNTDSCSPHYDFKLFLYTTIFISIWLVSFTAWKLWRWHVLYFYYTILGYLHDRKYRKNRQRHEYDAFISYNCHDEDWVFYHLVPNLEGTYNWKLCLHHRDFEPGKAIVDNIIDNIYKSRKTICIISRHYLASEWCSKEMQVASYRLFDEHADVLILLFLENIPQNRFSRYHQIRRVMRKKTYLLWPENLSGATLFWHMVNQALTENGTQEEENINLINGDL